MINHIQLGSVGKLVATGSEDSSIKIIDVNRALAKAEETEDSEASKTMKEQMETHPVIRTLYDHTGVSSKACSFLLFGGNC